MGLFEWFGESYNPGPIGGIGGAEQDDDEHQELRGFVLFKFSLSLIIVAVVYYLIFTKLCLLNYKNFMMVNVLVALYLVFAYLVRPNPNFSNVGLLGGLIDHPFRYSDDINRFLLFLMVILYPGKFIVLSIVKGIILFRN